MSGGNISIHRAVDAFIDYAESRVNDARELDPTRSRDEAQSNAYRNALHELAECLVNKTPSVKKELTEAGFLRAQSPRPTEAVMSSRRKHDPKIDLAIFQYANREVNSFYDSELFEYLKEQKLSFIDSTIRTKLSRFTGSPNHFLLRLGNKKSGAYQLTEAGRKHFAFLNSRHGVK